MGYRGRRSSRRPRGPRRRGGRTQTGSSGLRDASQGGRSRGEETGGQDDSRQGRPRDAERRADRTGGRTREVDPAAGDGEEARRAIGLVAELGAELARSAPDTVTAALNDAVRRADSLGCRHDEASGALREVTAQLKVYGTEGCKGQLDAAQTEREHAVAEYLRMHRRARA